MKKAIFLISCLAALTSLISCKKESRVHPVALIGMDGLEWRIVRQLTASGDMPNLKRILDNGVQSEMGTLEPMLSPAIWTTVATGVLPEEHGITWFMVKDANGNMIPVTSAQRRAQAIWNITTENGKDVDVIGWWASWPAEKVRGNIVSDHMAFHVFNMQGEMETDLANTYPASLNNELAPLREDPFKIPTAELQRYMKIDDQQYRDTINMKLLCEDPVYKDCDYCKGASKVPFCYLNPTHHFLRALATLDTYDKISLKLLQKSQPDLFMVYFEWVDTISHQYIKFAPPRQDWVTEDLYATYSDVIRQVYKRQDEVLGELLKSLSPDTNIVIMSDHGFRIGDERLREDKMTDVSIAHLWHNQPAFLAMSGPDIRKGGKQIEANVIDICPTLLALMGLPVPDYMKGNVLSDAIDPAFLQKHPINRVKANSVTQVASGEPTSSSLDPQIKERLKALGYIGNVDDTGLEMNRARLFLDKKQYSEAEQVLKKMLAREPEDIKALVVLGDLYMKMNRYNEAVDCYYKVEKIPPAHVKPEDKEIVTRIMASLGLALLNAGKMDESLTWCSQSAENDPSNFIAQFCLGRIAELQDRPEDAIKRYELAVRIDPKAEDAQLNLGNCYQRKQMYQQAIEHYMMAARANPDNFAAHNNAAVAYEKLDKLEEAEKEARSAIKINPHQPQTRLQLGSILMRRKKYSDAAEVFSEIVNVRPRDGTAIAWAARAYVMAGDVQRSVEMLKKLHSMNPVATERMIASEPAFSGIDPMMLR